MLSVLPHFPKSAPKSNQITNIQNKNQFTGWKTIIFEPVWDPLDVVWRVNETMKTQHQNMREETILKWKFYEI